MHSQNKFNRSRNFSSRPPSRGGKFGGNKHIDVSLFVKKATSIEQDAYVPQHTFADFTLSEQIKQNVAQRGYIHPTPIQDQSIPEILQGKDVIGIANTGTGKTAAFLLPIIDRLSKNPQQRALIIAPTRELATQIEDEFWAFIKNIHLRSALCIGGTSMGRQLYLLKRTPQVVIGTPGRLKDLERQGGLNFNDFQTIVLDEVDRMLDMGFIKDITYIVEKLPQPRHSLFFSATVPAEIRGLMNSFLTNPLTISVKTQESSDRVNQDVVKLNGKAKIEVLHELLIKEGFDKVLLFGRTKWGIDKLLKELLIRGFKVAAIHGNKRQSQRQRALDEFKSDRIQILLATDVASRGIDVSGVTHVINYDLPVSYEDYIHRIGRTGRADKFGTALTFID